MLPELNELDAWLAAREADVPNLRPDCAKQVVWHGDMAQTEIALVYVHGFSATLHEVRPLPDLVAQALGANIYYARLAGHGQDGAAMGRATLAEWDADVAEALEIGTALGKRVLLMGCSTGCTLLTAALARGADAMGVVHISPNYGLRHWVAQTLLDLPGVRRWGPLVAGRERSFDPISDAHTAYWTVKYDTQAVFTMGEAVRAVRRADLGAIKVPAYFAFSEADQVVHPARTRAVMDRWGGPVTEDVLVAGPEDDAMAHVMAGDVFSPGQTAPLAARLIEWAKDL